MINRFTSRRQFLGAAALAMAAVTGLSGMAAAQGNYPEKPVTIISPYPPGSFGDVFPRAVADLLTQRMGQNFLVENRPGATHMIGARAAADAKPDGYTLLFGSVTTFALNPSLQPNLPYDPLKDFAPVSLSYETPLFLVTRPDLDVDNVQDLVKLLKDNPGKYTFASGGIGSSTHLAGELFKVLAGVDARHVPYAGTGPAMVDVMAGHVDFVFSGSGLAQSEGGRLKVLAVTSAKRTESAPDVPTMQESGVDDYQSSIWFGFVAPDGTPPEITKAIADTIREGTDDLRKRLGDTVADGTFVNSSPEEFGDFIANEIPRWKKVIDAGNIEVE